MKNHVVLLQKEHENLALEPVVAKGFKDMVDALNCAKQLVETNILSEDQDKISAILNNINKSDYFCGENDTYFTIQIIVVDVEV